MHATSIGDLSMAFLTRLNNTRLKVDLQKVSQELASGRTTDLSKATGGDLGSFASIETALKTLSAYDVAAREAGQFVDTLQRSFETVQSQTSDLAPALLLASSAREATLVQSAAVDAKARFETVVSVLNTRLADRAILAGTATSDIALADVETMLADLQTAIAGAATADDVEAAVAAWFDDPGGGFETLGYLGATNDMAPFRIGPDEEAAVGLRADDDNLRDLFKGYAMAALVADDALLGNHDERVALIGKAATQLMAGDKALAEMRAGIGTIEARIDAALAQNGAETAALELARAEIVQVDPYEAATRLQSVETQLETLYTITARLSRLNLAEYLR